MEHNDYDWRDYFTSEPCTEGWLYGLEILVRNNGDFDKSLLKIDIATYLSWAVTFAKNVKPETLRELANDKHWSVRDSVACRANTPIETLRELANDKHWSVRDTTAINPNTPLEILEKLANDDASIVRESVAMNPNTPLEILEKMKRDDDARATAIKVLVSKSNK